MSTLQRLVIYHHSVKTGHWHNAVLTMTERLRWWLSIQTYLGLSSWGRNEYLKINTSIVWSEIKQIWVIYTHLKFCVATSWHNLNWAKIKQDNLADKELTLWLPGRGACQDPDILVYEFYFSSFEAGIANAISSFKWRKIHKCSIYLTKICVILWLRSLTNDDGNFRHVW